MGGGIVLGVLILVYFARMRVFAAALFGAIVALAAAGLVHFLGFAPIDIALGVVVAAVVLGSILRESNEDRVRGERRT